MGAMHIVAKFGGSSVADATAIKRSAKITFEQKAVITVVSATYGTTDQLVELSKKAVGDSWEVCEDLLEQIYLRHQKIGKNLALSSAEFTQMETIFQEAQTLVKGTYFLKDLTPKAYDALLSVGERVSSLLFTNALQELYRQDCEVINFDVRQVLRTNNQFKAAVPLFDAIAALAREHFDLKNNRIVYVTQGFIGATAEGVTTTLGRGGSDYSASILAEAIGADKIQIWTDVAGIATTDPKICPDARPIPEISFKEAAEMAVFGAKVLHPTTLLPANRAQIPVFVGSSIHPEQPGTWIKDRPGSAPLVRAIALKKQLGLITISTPKMLNAHGFLAKIFKIFNEYRISVDSITTSEISVSLTIDDATLLSRELVAELQQFAQVEVEEDFSLVSLIGNNMNHTPGLAHKIFSALEDINVRMICLGASKHNFCLLVKRAMGEQAVQRLHQLFISANHTVEK